MSEPFSKVIVDCVGPLPKTKAGNAYLLTIMCQTTRYPEAIPLRKISASAIVKALTKFFTTFGLPKFVQTDQGSNFLSGVFQQSMKLLGIEHQISSAYHPAVHTVTSYGEVVWCPCSGALVPYTRTSCVIYKKIVQGIHEHLVLI